MEGGRRQISTFTRATQLLGTISGRRDYTDPGEKFENVTMMLFEPIDDAGLASVKLVDTLTKERLTEQQYFARLLEIHNRRNPHALIEALEEALDEGVDENGSSAS